MEKRNLNIAIIGHASGGKTTTAGYLLYKLRVWDKKTMDDFEALSSRVDFSDRKYFLFCGNVNSYKESDSTRFLTKWRYSSDKFQGELMDVGCDNKEYIEKLSTHKRLCVMICMSATDFEDDEALNEVYEQIVAVGSLGVPMFVAVNKMDATNPPYSQELFECIEKDVASHVSKCGFGEEHVACIPFSAASGANFLEPSSDMTWFKGWLANHEGRRFSGMTVLDLFDHIAFILDPIDLEEAGTDRETDPPPTKKPRIVGLGEYLQHGISFLESAKLNDDFVFDTKAQLNSGIMLSGSKGIGQRVLRFVRENTNIVKIFDLFADGLTMALLKKHLDEARYSAPSVVLLRSVEKASKELAPTLSSLGTVGKLVFVVATTSKLDLVDASIRAAFEVLEIKE